MRRVLAAAFAVAGVAHGAPFNTWGVHVGNGVAGVTTYVYGREVLTGTRFANPVVYGEFGVSERLEIDLGVGGVLGGRDGVRASSFELMGRYFLSPESALVLHGVADRDADLVTVGPAIHGVYALGASSDLTLNALWAPRVGGGEVSAGAASITVAPEHYFARGVSTFVELVGHASLDAARAPGGGRFHAEAVPGVALRIGAMHELCMGVGVPVFGPPLDATYVGLWYSVASSGTAVRVP